MVNRDILFSYTFVKPVLTACILLLLTAFLSGCLAFRQPAELEFTSGAVIKAFSSNASFSYAAPGRSISGSGVLMYLKPDQIRAVILSPFGNVLQEFYISGDQVTIIDAGNGSAFSGTIIDLPDTGNLSGWRYIHWLIDIDPPESSRRPAVIERTNRYGHKEKAVFENGLLMSKTTAAGGHVRYGRYTSVRGVAFPLEIMYETVAKEKFTILFEDPEINVPFADGTFTSKPGKYRVYPLSGLR